jgi:hypothetical protein
MKTIEAIQIWDKGTIKEAKILSAFAHKVVLNTSAEFYYQLFSETEDFGVGPRLVEGNLKMEGEAYTQWEVDTYAWDWIAEQLNLTITGDYVSPSPPTPEPTTNPESIVEPETEPIVESETTE